MRIQHIITDYIARTLLSVNGDIITRISGVASRLAIGTTNQVLRVNVGGTALEYVELNSIDDVAGLSLKCKRLDIGAWDLVASVSKDVNHGLTLSDIIGLSGVIMHDDSATRYPFGSCYFLGNGDNDLSIAKCTATYLRIHRRTGSGFDHVNFDDAVMNRGFIFIWYLA